MEIKVLPQELLMILKKKLTSEQLFMLFDKVEEIEDEMAELEEELKQLKEEKEEIKEENERLKNRTNESMEAN